MKNEFMLTYTGGGGRFLNRLSIAFTMAEILLSLTIIGVVAAITLPSLTGNINERTWNTQRKALYARMSQAIALMPALNGYGSTAENAAETFVTAGLSKVLKINNICDNAHIQDCGIASKINTMAGSTISDFAVSGYTLASYNSMFNGAYHYGDTGSSVAYSQLDTQAVAFETANSESVLLFYNPNCKIAASLSPGGFSQPLMCANLVYDLNGNKGPNTVGKDIGFMSILYAVDPVVAAPVPLAKNFSGAQINASKICTQNDSESRLPNMEEVASLFYNRALIDMGNGGALWSSTLLPTSDANRELQAWRLSFNVGTFNLYPRGDSAASIRCVKR